jgi:hypothetical protein
VSEASWETASRSAPAQSAASFCSPIASPNWRQPAPTAGIHSHYRKTPVSRAVHDCTTPAPFNRPGRTVKAEAEVGRNSAIKEDDVAIKPKALTMEEAASIPLVGLTAWQAPIERARLKHGQKVLFARWTSPGIGWRGRAILRACPGTTGLP